MPNSDEKIPAKHNKNCREFSELKIYEFGNLKKFVHETTGEIREIGAVNKRTIYLIV